MSFKEIDKKGSRLSLGLIEKDVRKLFNGRILND